MLGEIFVLVKKLGIILGFLVFCAMISCASAIKVEDHGVICVKENQTFNITLRDAGDGGYKPWAVNFIDKNQIKLISQNNNVDLDGLSGKGMVGYFGYDILKFKAIQPGISIILLATQQQWNKNSTILVKYTVFVNPMYI